MPCRDMPDWWVVSWCLHQHILPLNNSWSLSIALMILCSREVFLAQRYRPWSSVRCSLLMMLCRILDYCVIDWQWESMYYPNHGLGKHVINQSNCTGLLGDYCVQLIKMYKNGGILLWSNDHVSEEIIDSTWWSYCDQVIIIPWTDWG